MGKSLSRGLKELKMPAERDEAGKFKKSSPDEQMNSWICSQIANKSGKRLMRRLIDNDARLRMEAEQNGD
jgi:hypothetical protein